MVLISLGIDIKDICDQIQYMLMVAIQTPGSPYLDALTSFGCGAYPVTTA
jgi:hypothetical protein